MENPQNEYFNKSAGEIEEIVKESFFTEDEERAYEAINQFLSSSDCSGSPDEFHNLSVNFSKKDDYITACRIIEMGLKNYPYSTDLLADYLQIGLYCNKELECKEYYDTLFSIPKTKWTWRGFSFSIDYLRIITERLRDEQSILENKEKMLCIADEYAKYYPYEEDVYLSRSGIFSYFNEKEKEIDCLIAATNKGRKTPKCNLKLADFYFSQGDYKKALEYIERNKIDGIDVQDRINVGYMYYLSGLCRTAILQMSKDFHNYEAVMQIYQDFHIAEEIAMNYTLYAKNIERQTCVLGTLTGINYDDAVERSFALDNGEVDIEDDDTEDEGTEDTASIKSKTKNTVVVSKPKKKTLLPRLKRRIKKNTSFE